MLTPLYVSSIDYSDNLFNLDNKIEFVVQYSSVDLNEPKVRIYNEDGDILFEKNGLLQGSGGDLNAVVGFDSKFKLVIIDKDYKKCEVYSLPGNLPLSVTSIEDEKLKYDIKLYPNPSNNNKISIAYTLPENVKLSKVNIYNTLGQVVKTVKPDNQSNTLDIDTQNLQKGTYFCELVGNKGKISASQFIIQ